MVETSPRPVSPGGAPRLAVQEPNLAHQRSQLTAAIRHAGTSKEIALMAGTSVRTASRYRNGKAIPDGVRLTRLARWSTAVKDWLLRAIRADDRSLAEDLAALEQRFHELRERDGIAHGIDGGGPPGEQTGALAGGEQSPDVVRGARRG